MNPIIILLGIITILFILYYLYLYYATNTDILVSYINLNDNTTSHKLIEKIDTSYYNFTYSVWIYISKWDNNIFKYIICQGDKPDSTRSPSSSTSSLPPPPNGNFTLYIDKTTPSLFCNIFAPTTSIKNQLLSSNFPLQSWTHVLLSVNNYYLDYYLNGKLMNSYNLSKLNNEYRIDNSSRNISIGGSVPTDIQLAKVSFISKSTDPQTAWNIFLQGSGQSNNSNSTNIELSYLKNNMKQKLLSL